MWVTSPVSLNAVQFSIFKLMMGLGQTDEQTQMDGVQCIMRLPTGGLHNKHWKTATVDFLQSRCKNNSELTVNQTSVYKYTK